MAVAGTADGVEAAGEEIAFFDVETTVPVKSGQGFALLEFGAILVCPRKLEEKWNYSSLIRPADISLISTLSVRCNGISRDLVLSAPSFSDIADTVYNILHGRIWAGHNITRFDCARIREAFGEIGRSPPEPKGIIDSLAILTQRFGRRAGDMKMATLANYFGLGKQTHRSLDDVRMNLEVLKYCATVLFLESSLPEAFPDKSWVSPNAVTRSRKNGKSISETIESSSDLPSTSKGGNFPAAIPVEYSMDGNHPILSLASNVVNEDPFDMGSLGNEMASSALLVDDSMEEETVNSSKMPITSENAEGPSSCSLFLEPDEVLIASITASQCPYFRGTQRVVLLHNDIPLQIFCPHVKVRFGLSRKFLDYAGRPRLSFVVNASPSLCKVLDACDKAGQRLYNESGGTSDWRQAVSRKDGFENFPTIRLNLPTVVNGDEAQLTTEIYQKEPSGSIEKLSLSKIDASEVDHLIIPGTFVDVYISLSSYDVQQNAGIRLVANKIVLHNS